MCPNPPFKKSGDGPDKYMIKRAIPLFDKIIMRKMLG